ncbi:shikimate dehydrogenase [Bosea sp. (in: a-proteobacteria)]|uniref:shikimate dehydrogenase n=1 Tax=Bosea sp. (in: a-proteobacteria) TaxID=1871050 RepID=UPI003F72A09D
MTTLTGRTRLAGLLGWPVMHSRSPLMHGHLLKRHGIDGAYVPLPVERDFETAVRGLRAAGFRGANVTKPHKEAAFAICDIVEPSALRAGAVNTLVFDERGITGSNTDGFGFMAGLAEAGVATGGAHVLVLGAGGGARAVCAALLEAGATVTLANRSRDRAERVAAALPGLEVTGWEERARALEGCDLLVNTTSLGMAGSEPLALDLRAAKASLCVADIVYVPLETPLLAQARAASLRTVDGLAMLLHQARPGFKAWFGVDPVIDGELRALVLASLNG